MKKNTILFITSLLLFGFLAGFIMFWATGNGVGVSPDSVIYIGTARNLLEGRGYYMYDEPMRLYPPAYPTLLAISGSLFTNILESTRWLHVLFYSSNCVLFGLLIYINTRHNLIAMVAGNFIFLASSAILTVHTYAWSEPPFFTFVFLSFLLLHFYIKSKRWIFLFCSSIMLSLTLLTRYVGIAVLPPIIISLFLFDKKPIHKKIINSLVFITIVSIPYIIWLLGNPIVSQKIETRSIIFHPISLIEFLRSTFTYYYFFLPSSGVLWVDVLGIIIFYSSFVFLFFVYYKNWSEKKTKSKKENLLFIITGLLFVVFYYLLLIFSISFYSSATHLNARILSPIFIMSILVLFPLVLSLSEMRNKKKIWWVFISCTFILSGINLNQTVDTIRESHINGLGYNSILWDNSPTLDYLNSIDLRKNIYTNGKDVIHFKTGANVNYLPAHTSSGTLLANENFQEELFSICNEVKSGEAIIVYFEYINWRWYLPTEEELKEKCQLPILFQADDGTIFGLNGS